MYYNASRYFDELKEKTERVKKQIKERELK